MIILPHSVFLMPPRTASTWACRAMKNAGVRYRQYGAKHSVELPPGAPAFRFCLTRNPSTWLRSRWTLGPWTDDLAGFWDIDFDKFRAAVSDAMVTMYFGKYVAACKPTGYVGAVESAADDLVHALRLAGEEFDEVALRDTPRLNASPPGGQLIPEVYWSMRREELGRLPADHIAALPIELIPRLPAGTLERLPPATLVATLQRLNRAALESAGAAARAGR